MSEQFEIANDAEIEAAVKSAQDALNADPSAPREISVTIKFHKHEEYPKVFYKGKDHKSIANAQEEAAAASDGFGPYDHEAFTAKEA